jgi:lysophospholipase L1-like esterase
MKYQSKRCGLFGVLSLLIALVYSTSWARAGDFVWTGAKDANWNDAANWLATESVPGQNDAVVVGGLKQSTKIVLSSDGAVHSLTFDPRSLLPCTIEGRSFVLANKSQIDFLKLPSDVGFGKTAIQAIASDLKLSGRVTFRNQNRWYYGGERLSIRGRISGTGTIVIGGGKTIGSIEFSGDNTKYQGDIVIESGNLIARKASSLGSGRTPIRLEGGAFTIGGNFSSDRDFVIVKDSAWSSHGPSGNHDGTITVNRDATWTIGNGGGNTMTLRGIIQGAGNVAITARGTTFSGSNSNTLKGAVSVGGSRGATILARDEGVNVIAGPLVMRANGTLRWDSNEQIADSSAVTFDGKMPTLDFHGHQESLGTLNLVSDGRIDLGKSTARVIFADSSDQTWDTKKVLLIHGGVKARGSINFGKTETGLTLAQLNKIGFVDPVGYAPGTYTAKLLTNGDLVPTGERVQPLNLPFDLSDEAHDQRTALYSVAGMAKLADAKTPLKPEMTISVFGDSITWGGGYLRQLNNALNAGDGSKKLNVKIVNHGVNGGGVLSIRDGDNSKNHAGKTRPLPFAQTIATDHSDIAVIYIGVNDVWWRNTKPDVFEQALRDMVAQAKDNKTIPVLATLALMREAIGSRNPNCDKFAGITRKVARETGATLVDLRAAFMACLENESITIRPGGEWTSDGKLLTHDGVHMNGRGDKMLADLIAEGIYKSLQP